MASASKVIQITNIAPQATRDQMHALFGFLGKIEEIKLYPTIRDVAVPVQSRICYVKYQDAGCVNVALHMTNTVFIDRAIIVFPYQNEIPDEREALELTHQGSMLPGLFHIEPKFPPNVTNKIEGMPPYHMVTTHDRRFALNSVPPYPPLPATYDARKIEEIRRTVLLKDVDPKLSPQEVIDYFCSNAGEVKYMRFCSKEGELVRYALVEFTDQQTIVAALQMDGKLLGDRAVRVFHSTQEIIKPQAKSNEAAQREIEEAMTRLREAQNLISAAIDPVIGMLAKDKKRGRSRSRSRRRSHSRSRRRSRSRSRSRRSRHRSHSRRSHSRRRSHSSHHHRSSRSRSHSRRRSHSRSGHSKSSGSHDRKDPKDDKTNGKKEGKKKEETKGEKTPERRKGDRDSGKSKSGSREKEKEKDKERDKGKDRNSRDLRDSRDSRDSKPRSSRGKSGSRSPSRSGHHRRSPHSSRRGSRSPGRRRSSSRSRHRSKTPRSSRGRSARSPSHGSRSASKRTSPDKDKRPDKPDSGKRKGKDEEKPTEKRASAKESLESGKQEQKTDAARQDQGSNQKPNDLSGNEPGVNSQLLIEIESKCQIEAKDATVTAESDEDIYMDICNSP